VGEKCWQREINSRIREPPCGFYSWVKRAWGGGVREKKRGVRHLGGGGNAETSYSWGGTPEWSCDSIRGRKRTIGEGRFSPEKKKREIRGCAEEEREPRPANAKIRGEKKRDRRPHRI